jgi:hypothetical protein
MIIQLYENIRITRDDLTPFLYDNPAIVAKMIELCNKNCPIDVLLWQISDISGIKTITWDEVKQLIADAKARNALAEVAIAGDLLPDAITRAAAPVGLGCSTATGGVWCNAPDGEFVLRFYCNGDLKTVLENYNFTDLTTLGAVPGDIIQACQVVDGVPGWWARITVP